MTYSHVHNTKNLQELYPEVKKIVTLFEECTNKQENKKTKVI